MEGFSKNDRNKMRLAILCILLGMSLDTYPQSNRKSKRPGSDPFLKTQWWLGLRAGTNVTKGVPDESFTSFSPINYSAERNVKSYDGFSKPGIQAGLELAFYTKGITVSLQPGFATMFYRYTSSYNWSDPANPSNSLSQTFKVEDNVQVFDLPLLVKYEFLQGNIHPFIQVGVYYNLLINAGKKLDVEGIDNASGSDVPFSGDPIEIGTSDLYTSSSGGVMGGVGVVYDAGNVRMLFDVNYKYGLSNITQTGARYSNNQLASIGDIQDDLKLQSLWFSLSIQFPLKFISKNYEAVN